MIFRPHIITQRYAHLHQNVKVSKSVKVFLNESITTVGLACSISVKNGRVANITEALNSKDFFLLHILCVSKNVCACVCVCVCIYLVLAVK